MNSSIRKIKKELKELLQAPIHQIRRNKAKSSLTPLTTHGDARLKLIADAIYETITNNVSEEEKKWITMIEQRRSFLLHSKVNLHFGHYYYIN